MRIALFLNAKLGTFEAEIIEYILNSSNLELILIFIDARESLYSNYILDFQKRVEKRLFKLECKKSIDLSGIERVYIKPNRYKDYDIIDDELSLQIASYHIDLIINLSSNLLKGKFLNYLKYGVLNVVFDSGLNSNFASLYSIIKKYRLIQADIVLQNSNRFFLIDRVYINRNFSFVKSNYTIKHESAISLIKYIELIDNLNADVYNSNFTNIYPKFSDVFRYFVNFYSTFVNKVYKRVSYKLFKSRYDCWSLFVGKGDIFSSSFDLIKLKPKKDQFWADPFIYKKDGQIYIFFENYSYSKDIGKISCGRLDKDRLVDIEDVLVKDYHLSYPFLFEDNGQLFMIPECSENRRLEVYKCVKFPNEWELYSVAFEGEILFDSTIYRDKDGNLWLFTNKQTSNCGSVDAKLYIYKIDSLKLKEILPHKKNPVIINSGIGRNGGAIFEKNGKIYRPSQANVDGVYGRYLNINEIKTLNLNEYQEEVIKVINPTFDRGLISLHHLHQLDDIFIVDSAYKKI